MRPMAFIKCRGCGKKILFNPLKYCPLCAQLARRMAKHLSPEDKKALWAYVFKNGHRCAYSGVDLEMDDFSSPWYAVISHINPVDEKKIVLAAAVFNAMKSRLSKKDFYYYVQALDDHRRKHLKFKKRPLVYWRQLLPSGDNKACPVCGHPVASKWHKYCVQCSRIVVRMRQARFPRQSIDDILGYAHNYGYICYYTGMQLDLDNLKSPWYLVFDHWMPRDPRKMVITSALVNYMKSDLTEAEFWYFIRQLADFHRKGTPVRKRKLVYWSRSYLMKRKASVC